MPRSATRAPFPADTFRMRSLPRAAAVLVAATLGVPNSPADAALQREPHPQGANGSSDKNYLHLKIVGKDG